MPEIWKKEFELLLMRRYSVPEALKASEVLLPAIFGDFRQMLASAVPNEMVHEEYRTEDGKTVIHLYGKRIPQPARKHHTKGGPDRLVIRRLLVEDFEVRLPVLPDGSQGILL
ncbi:MAG: hypothetical protein ACSW8H_08050 [bacterium]